METKLLEHQNQGKNTMITFKIYFDLDGVLANFEKKILDIANEYYCLKLSSTENIKYQQKQEIIRMYNARGGKFYQDLELYPGAMHLVFGCASIKNVEIEILTSIGHTDAENTYKQKCAWVKKHFSGLKVNVTKSGAEKVKYSHKNTFLIDDSVKAVQEFTQIETGGIGLFFNNRNESEWGYMIWHIKELIKQGVEKNG